MIWTKTFLEEFKNLKLSARRKLCGKNAILISTGKMIAGLWMLLSKRFLKPFRI
jgi:hypothetical protein